MKDTDVPAYPTQTVKSNCGMEYIEYEEGMTLRDWFAGHSNITIEEMLAVYKAVETSEPMNITGICKDLAKMNCIYADAMMKERKK